MSVKAINTEKGFIPVMLTPFKENGTIDFETLTRLTEFYLQAGATGLFANCLSSEMYQLTPDERLQIVDHVVRIANGAVPVLATGSFGGPINEQAAFVKKIYEKGVDAVILITSLLANKEDGNTLFEKNVFELLEQTEQIPLGFYECPLPFKRILSAGQLGRFLATGRIMYHKDTCLNLHAVKEKISVSSANKKFGLYDAYMVHAVDSLKAGSAGLACIQGNYFPELVVWLCKNYGESDLQQQVTKTQRFFIEHMEVMHDQYPVSAKYFLQKRGFDIATYSRTNGRVFDSESKKKIDLLYKAYELITQEIGMKEAI